MSDGPLVSILLLSFRQRDTVRVAVEAALAQTYAPLEVVVSDDCSDDGTFDVIQAVAQAYEGPHKLRINRNERNLGTGANLARAMDLSQGEMIVLMAGDDISLPNRCERIMDVWRAHDRKLDLIASDVYDMDQQGEVHGVIQPQDLSGYRGPSDWVANPPHIVGAAQAWTRRLYDRFGHLPKGVLAEDLIMVFRAVCMGGGINLREPLVKYRRGGVSTKRRAMSAQDVVKAWLANNRRTLFELPVIGDDARKLGCEKAVEPWLTRQLEYEHFLRDIFAADAFLRKFSVAFKASNVPISRRARVFVYAACPALLAPYFFLKRILA
jgi:glycosyltransferase involved in cell wall biosynthesis